MMHLEQLEHELGQQRKNLRENMEVESTKLRAEVSAGAAGWRKEADGLAAQLAELQRQVGQTHEAVMWASKEVTSLREDFMARQARGDPPPQKVQQARAELWAAAEAFDSRCAATDNAVEALKARMEDALCDFKDRLDVCTRGLARTNDFFAEAVSSISGDIATLSRGLGAVEAAAGLLEGSQAMRSNAEASEGGRQMRPAPEALRPSATAPAAAHMEAAPLPQTCPSSEAARRGCDPARGAGLREQSIARRATRGHAGK